MHFMYSVALAWAVAMWGRAIYLKTICSSSASGCSPNDPSPSPAIAGDERAGTVTYASENEEASGNSDEDYSDSDIKESPIKDALQRIVPSRSSLAGNADCTTLYVFGLIGRDRVSGRMRCNCHVVYIKEDFTLELANDALPVLEMLDPVSNFMTAILGTSLFVAGGWWPKGRSLDPRAAASRWVYSIDTHNPGDGWQRSTFLTPRLCPRLVVSGGSLYAFGYGGEPEEYGEKSSHHNWAEVYDGERREWSYVKVNYDSSTCALPSDVYGDVMDAEGNLFLFGWKGIVMCRYVSRGECNITLLQTCNKITHHPTLIGRCVYTLGASPTVVYCHDVKTLTCYSVELGKHFDLGKRSIEELLYFSFRCVSGCNLIPVADDGLYAIELYGRFNILTSKDCSYSLCCKKYIFQGPSVQISKSTLLPDVKFSSIKKCMIVRKDGRFAVA